MKKDKIVKAYEEYISKRNIQEIPMPVYFYEDEETGEKHYDFEEMANELENRICKSLKRNVLITISELEDGMDKDDMDINDLTFNPIEIKF